MEADLQLRPSSFPFSLTQLVLFVLCTMLSVGGSCSSLKEMHGGKNNSHDGKYKYCGWNNLFLISYLGGKLTQHLKGNNIVYM